MVGGRLLWMLPMILESSSGPHADLVQRIYQDVRGPHHYVVTSFWRAFLPWLGWQALGAGALVEMRASWGDRGDRVQRALLAILLLVSFCASFSSVIRIRSINHLFAWRVAPIGALIAQVTLLYCLGGACAILASTPARHCLGSRRNFVPVGRRNIAQGRFAPCPRHRWSCDRRGSVPSERVAPSVR